MTAQQAPAQKTHARPRVVLVTGAAGGMGGAHARRLARDGATVVLADREPSEAMSALAHELRGHAVAADVQDWDAVRAMVEEVRVSVGDVDVLVANHAHMSMAPVLEHDLDEWWRVVDVNLGGTMALVQAVLPGMGRRGGGRVVVVSSEWGLTGWPGASAYAASKAGLVSLVKTLGRELAPRGVVVNGVAPGVVDTPQLEVDARAAGTTLDEVRRAYAAATPLGRIGRPEEVAAVVALLADPGLGTLVGQVVQVNGGTSRGRA